MNTRITISITPELNSALTRAALDKNTNVSRQVEIYLRENPSIISYIKEIESESEGSVLAVGLKKNQDTKLTTRSSTKTEDEDGRIASGEVVNKAITETLKRHQSLYKKLAKM